MKKLRWTREEDDIIKKKYPNSSCVEFSILLPLRTKEAIKQRAYKFNVKKYDAITRIYHSIYELLGISKVNKKN